MTETTKTARDAAGKALYLEFRKGDNTLQFVVTPDIVDLSGKPQPSYFMRRKISSWSPRRAWNIDTTTDRKVIDTPGGGRKWITHVDELKRDSMGDFLADVSCQDNFDIRSGLLQVRMAYRLSSLFYSLGQQGWGLYKNPLVVEVSYEDIDNLSKSTTPNSLIRRITRSRIALGWGESLIGESTPTAV